MQQARDDRRPLIVGVGGSTRDASVTDRLMRGALARTEALGARTVAFGGDFLARLPIFGTPGPAPDAARELTEAVAVADGLIVATPGYHGGMSGLVKNGLDHLELLREAPRPYLDGRAVGVIVAAAGWQACGSTLVAVRSTVHALRGWPTPFGVAVNSAEPVFGEAGEPGERIAGALDILAGQVVEFTRWRRAAGASSPSEEKGRS